ncbi:MAG TPA: hypothetical protein VFA68_00055 [Terriglobales bacterium]|nr:hypothetical protein [Terriglobales bacterium]
MFGTNVSSHRWWSLAIFGVLAILCGLSFLKYLGWAAFYSGNPSAGEAAGQRAELFFWAFIALEALAGLVMAMRIRLEGMFSTSAVRTLARYAMGLVISIATTAVVVGVLAAIGSRMHR